MNQALTTLIVTQLISFNNSDWMIFRSTIRPTLRPAAAGSAAAMPRRTKTLLRMEGRPSLLLQLHFISARTEEAGRSQLISSPGRVGTGTDCPYKQSVLRRRSSSWQSLLSPLSLSRLTSAGQLPYSLFGYASSVIFRPRPRSASKRNGLIFPPL